MGWDGMGKVGDWEVNGDGFWSLGSKLIFNLNFIEGIG
jgi:hypothetical protein